MRRSPSSPTLPHNGREGHPVGQYDGEVVDWSRCRCHPPFNDPHRTTRPNTALGRARSRTHRHVVTVAGSPPSRGAAGRRNVSRSDAEPFVVGDSLQLHADVDGRLFLGVNDNGLDNDDGALSVTITRLPGASGGSAAPIG